MTSCCCPRPGPFGVPCGPLADLAGLQRGSAPTDRPPHLRIGPGSDPYIPKLSRKKLDFLRRRVLPLHCKILTQHIFRYLPISKMRFFSSRNLQHAFTRTFQEQVTTFSKTGFYFLSPHPFGEGLHIISRVCWYSMYVVAQKTLVEK